MYASPFYPPGPSGLLPGFLCLGQVRVPYQQRWARLCAISAQVDRFVFHFHRRRLVSQRLGGLRAISAEVGRFGCHIHRGGNGMFVCHIHRVGQVCMPYPQRWAGLGVISTEVGMFVCHSTEVDRFVYHIHRGGQICVL